MLLVIDVVGLLCCYCLICVWCLFVDVVWHCCLVFVCRVLVVWGNALCVGAAV